MRKYKNLVLGGIQQKIINLVLITIIVIELIYSVVVNYQVNNFRSITKTTSEQQLTNISELSTQTMNGVISSGLGKSTQLEAYIADDLFGDVELHVRLLGSYAQKIFDDPDSQPRLKAEPPDEENDNRVSVQLLTAQGVDIKAPEIVDKIGLIANMSDICSSLFENANINSCFIALPDGVALIADDHAGAKFDEDGNIITLPITERPWYVGAVEKGDLYFTDIEEDAFTGKIGIVCSMPIYKDGELAAVVGADLFLDAMKDAVVNSEENGSFAFIINENGHVVFSPYKKGVFGVETSEKAADLRNSDNKEFAAFIGEALKGSTDIELITLNDEEWYMSGAPMGTVGWAIISVVKKEVTDTPKVMLENGYTSILQNASDAFNKSINHAKIMLSILLILTFILAFTSALILAKKIVSPLERMTKRISDIGGSDLLFEMEDDLRTGDEIEVLAESFADISKRTLEYVDQIKRVTAEKERIGAELSMATEIQASQLPHLFPAFPDRPEFDIYASMTPAKEVGGDFYDFFLIDRDHIAMVMADVSGKGVPAALFMMISRILIKNRILGGDSPEQALYNVNNQLMEDNKASMFVTVWLAVLDIRTGKGFAANAGHEHPVIRRANGRYELVQYLHSPGVAMIDDIDFPQHEFVMNPGDSLFVYTDGVAEATNAKGELFGTDRMLEALNKEGDTTPEKTLENVMTGIQEFVAGAEQFDDITMLCLRYNGNEEENAHERTDD